MKIFICLPIDFISCQYLIAVEKNYERDLITDVYVFLGVLKRVSQYLKANFLFQS